jgi:hypothetical protein
MPSNLKSNSPKSQRNTRRDFRLHWCRYRDAHLKCQRLSGDALNDALDVERDAVEALRATSTDAPSDVLKKVAALHAILTEASAWNDGRDVRLLQSIKRDLAMSRRAS